jgi:hypothetical protein
MEATLQIMKLVAALLPRQQYPQIPVIPVQMDIIQPLLKRVAAAERRRTGPRHKLRTS